MMAKMFYTLDEAKAALGRTEEDIKQLSREGRLREFRDGPRLMFKADQVDALKAELGEGGGRGDHVDLGPSDTGAPIGLVDSRGGSSISSGTGNDMGGIGSGVGSGIGSGISLSGSGAGMSLADSEAQGTAGLKDDTSLATDLGLSGSIGGVPSPGRPGSGSGLSGLSNSGSGSRSGINMLGNEESHVDPMAQTSISSSIGDQVNLEGVGSGSGLLDLTRESDDTSLGAELLDEITPTSGGGGRRQATIGDSSMGGVAVQSSPAGRRIGFAEEREAPDALAPAFGGAALAAALFILYGAVVLTSSVLHTKPGLTEAVSGKAFPIVALIGAAAAIVFFIIGLLVGKSTTR